MCNFLHPNHKKAKRTKGIGYKCFKVNPDGRLTNLITWIRWDIEYCLYSLQKGDSLEWDEKFVSKTRNTGPGGFCFLPTKREAEKVMRRYNRTSPGLVVCYKIKYEVCIGRNLETAMFYDMSVETALCKKFTVLEKEVF